MPITKKHADGGGISGYVATAPNATGKPITNVYWNPDTQRMVGEYDDTGGAAGTIVSTPPPGKFAITNIFFDPVAGRLSCEYDDGV